MHQDIIPKAGQNTHQTVVYRSNRGYALEKYESGVLN